MLKITLSWLISCFFIINLVFSQDHNRWGYEHPLLILKGAQVGWRVQQVDDNYPAFTTQQNESLARFDYLRRDSIEITYPDFENGLTKTTTSLVTDRRLLNHLIKWEVTDPSHQDSLSWQATGLVFSGVKIHWFINNELQAILNPNEKWTVADPVANVNWQALAISSDGDTLGEMLAWYCKQPPVDLMLPHRYFYSTVSRHTGWSSTDYSAWWRSLNNNLENPNLINQVLIWHLPSRYVEYIRRDNPNTEIFIDWDNGAYQTRYDSLYYVHNLRFQDYLMMGNQNSTLRGDSVSHVLTVPSLGTKITHTMRIENAHLSRDTICLPNTPIKKPILLGANPMLWTDIKCYGRWLDNPDTLIYFDLLPTSYEDVQDYYMYYDSLTGRWVQTDSLVWIRRYSWHEAWLNDTSLSLPTGNYQVACQGIWRNPYYGPAISSMTRWRDTIWLQRNLTPIIINNRDTIPSTIIQPAIVSDMPGGNWLIRKPDDELITIYEDSLYDFRDWTEGRYEYEYRVNQPGNCAHYVRGSWYITGPNNLDFNNIEINSKVKIHPQPNSGYFFLTGVRKEANLILWSNQGNKIKILKYDSFNRIDISDMNNGLYYLQIDNIFYKILKMK